MTIDDDDPAELAAQLVDSGIIKNESGPINIIDNIPTARLQISADGCRWDIFDGATWLGAFVYGGTPEDNGGPKWMFEGKVDVSAAAFLEALALMSGRGGKAGEG